MAEPPSDPGSAPLDDVADELYALPPDAFIGARDDAAAAAKERGERELARAIGRLRRPTRAAWLANLLARHRGDQLDGLVALSAGLADAQRTLDGDTLRALTAQRTKLVRAMAREAGQLARAAREPVTDALLRELQGILEAALADPQVAAEVRAGRLTRTVTYSGFGPADGLTPSLPPVRRPAAPAPDGAASAAGPAPEPDAAAERAERERAERERRDAERLRRHAELTEAEDAQAQARARQEEADAERAAADEHHDRARARVAELVAALDAARHDEQAALEQARQAGAAAREAGRAAAAAATRAARARARLDDLDR